jgi:hypothetical protein
VAPSPVQAAWDVQLTDGQKIQVKYLANTTPAAGAWVNEHVVRSAPGVDWYALVIIEGFQVSGVAAFPAALAPICHALGKSTPTRTPPCSSAAATGSPSPATPAASELSACRYGCLPSRPPALTTRTTTRTDTAKQRPQGSAITTARTAELLHNAEYSRLSALGYQ